MRGILLATFILVAGAARGRDILSLGEGYDTVTTEVVTPHVAWAKPLEGGPVRVLVIAPRLTQRETAELMERVDLTVDAVMTHSPQELGSDAEVVELRTDHLEARLKALLAKPHEAVVLGGFAWQALPKPLQYALLAKVAAGAGLLQVLYAADPPELFGELFTPVAAPEIVRSGVPWGGVTDLDEAGQVVRAAGTLKSGRWLALRWPRGPGWFHCLTNEPDRRSDYEYQMALAARALLWVARREPPVTVAVGQPADGAAPVTVAGDQAPATLEAVVRDRWAEQVWSGSLPVRAGQAQLKLPELPGGRYTLDVWARAGERVLGWGSGWADVPAESEITTVKPVLTYYKPGDRADVEVELSRPLAEQSLLQATAVDQHGRQWSKSHTVVRAGNTFAMVSLVLIAPQSSTHRLLVELWQGRRILSRAEGELRTPLRQRPGFALGLWGGGGSSWIARQRHAYDHRLGIDAAIFSGGITEGVRGMPYIGHAYRHGGKSVERDPCFHDPAFWEKETKRLSESAAALVADDLFAYSLGDEICLDIASSDVCRSPRTLAAFREWLKAEYADLEAVNASWGTKHASWDAVVPLTWQQSRSAGNYASWMDHRRFMDLTFAEALARAKQVLQAEDPETPVGAEGLWGSYAPYAIDAALFCERLDLIVPYWRERLLSEAVRSFRRPGTITGAWVGNYGEMGIDPALLRWHVWNLLLNDYTSIWWWAEYTGAHFGAYPKALYPDYRASPGLAAVTEAVRELRSGVGPLLQVLDRRHDGVAVLYSRPSTILWMNQVDDLLIALEDLGLQYELVNADGLDAGELRRRGFKLLVMPATCVLGDPAVAAVKDFVAGGGSVLATLAPAVFDGRGANRPDSALAELFGVSGLGRDMATEAHRVTPREGEPFGVLKLVPGAVKTTAEVLASYEDGSPAATWQPHGAGGAALFRFTFAGYEEARELARDELPLREFLRRVVTRCGIRPAYELASDRPMRGVELARFGDQVIEVVALTREPLMTMEQRDQRPYYVELKLPAARSVRDLRSGRDFGRVQTVKLTLDPGECRLLALRESAPEPIALTATVGQRGGSAGIAVKAPGPARRAVELTVTRPDGEEAAWWRRVLTITDGAAPTSFPIALNDPLGQYQVTARDVATGQTIAASFAVR